MNYDGSPFEIINLGRSETIELRGWLNCSSMRWAARAHRSSAAATGRRACYLRGHNKGAASARLQPSDEYEAGVERFVEWFKKQPVRLSEYCKSASIRQISIICGLSKGRKQ